MIRSSFLKHILYAYIGILLAFAGFFGQVWVIQLTETVRVAGGNVIYAAVIMTSIVFVILENEITIIKDIIKLIIVIYLFEFLLYLSLNSLLSNPNIINTYNLLPELLLTPVSVMFSGGLLTILELLLFLLVFERIKTFSKHYLLTIFYFVLAFIVLLCIDGILFPILNYNLFPDLTVVIYGGLKNKIILGLLYAPILFIILLTYKSRFERYLFSRIQIKDMLGKSKEDLALLVAKQSSQIRESEEHYRFLVEGQSELITLFDPDTTLRFTNQAYQIFQGKDESELIGTKITDHLLKVDSVALVKHLNGFTPENNPQNNEQKSIRFDGEIRWHLWSNKAYFDEHGKVISFQSIGTDITEKKRMEKQLSQSQKMEAIGHLTGGVAHDFNNMLGIVSGNLELLKPQLENNPAGLERVNSALASTQRGVEITKKLLSFSSNSPSERFVVNPNTIIREMLQLIEKSLTFRIQIETRLSDNLWSTLIDPGDLQDAILNLSLNARDAMPNGGILVFQTLNKEFGALPSERNPDSPKGDYVLISVSDNGEGMAVDVLDKIFEPFFSTKEKTRGSGLGLSMVYGFVQRSKGIIRAYSEPDKGTAIHIYLPRAETESPVTGDIKPRPRTYESEASETILIVDDEQALLEIASAHLVDLGYKVICASNAHEALDILQRNRDIDLLFSDIIMPGGMDGYELAKAALSSRPDVKTLLVSGMANISTANNYTDHPYMLDISRSVLAKPYSKADLGNAIRTTLRKSD